MEMEMEEQIHISHINNKKLQIITLTINMQDILKDHNLKNQHINIIFLVHLIKLLILNVDLVELIKLLHQNHLLHGNDFIYICKYTIFLIYLIFNLLNFHIENIAENKNENSEKYQTCICYGNLNNYYGIIGPFIFCS